MKLRNLATFVSVGLSTLFLSGCASIIHGDHEQVEVNTNPPGAHCVLKNSKGRWVVNHTPQVVKVHRASAQLDVTCDKAGYRTAHKLVGSSVSGVAAGNVFAGGFIGAGVDAADGAAFEYPSQVNVTLHKGAKKHS